MTIILDENLPYGLVRMLAPKQVTTVQRPGYSGVENGELLEVLEGKYDVFLTADKNLRYQQNLAGRRLSIVELPTNRWQTVRGLGSKIIQAVERCEVGSYLVVAAD